MNNPAASGRGIKMKLILLAASGGELTQSRYAPLPD
jgi:hypothetical protein